MVKNHSNACCSNECKYIVQRTIKVSRKEYNRQSYLKVVYGMTPDKYFELLSKQGGRCANKACDAIEPGMNKSNWCIDHDHTCCPGLKSCGKCIRGLLCHRCNVSLGNLNDDVEKLLGLVEYVNTTKKELTL